MYNTIWYDNLTKPFLNPPSWIFTPVWIILYITIFIALILYTVVITKKNKLNGYVVFIVHMIFNLIWSPVFFLLKRIDIALFIIIIIDLTAIMILKNFWNISKISCVILIPYLAWLLFATYLNCQILILN